MNFKLFFVLFCLSFSFERVDGVFAVVGNEVLLKSEVDQQAYWFAAQNNINVLGDSLVFRDIYDSVAKQMIDNLVLFDLAKKDTNVVVLDEAVEEQLSLQLNQRVEAAGSISALETIPPSNVVYFNSCTCPGVVNSSEIAIFHHGFLFSWLFSLWYICCPTSIERPKFKYLKKISFFSGFSLLYNSNRSNDNSRILS